MVSCLPPAPGKTGAKPRPASWAALAALLLLLASFAGCSSSQCLRADCQNYAPSSAGAAATGGAAANGGAATTGKLCTHSADCASDASAACVSGRCQIACESHFDCQGYGRCQSAFDSENNQGLFCDPTSPQKPGQFYARCPAGSSDCDAANDFFCISAGTDDTDAYCSTDCTSDSSCAPGFACLPLTRPPCTASACPGLKGNPKDRSCIPNDQIGAGQAYQCDRRGVTRKACRLREFCSTCQTDADCRGVPNQVCAKDKSGTKICTEPCDPKHPSCPWGSAASCGVWDAELGQATCAHRFGQCTGTGKSCEPCLQDADCGSNGACTSSSFTGERWCVDFSVSCSCGSGAANTGLCSGGGCPESPSGLEVTCVDNTPDTPNSGFCNGANSSAGILTTSSQQTGCWPAR